MKAILLSLLIDYKQMKQTRSMTRRISAFLVLCMILAFVLNVSVYHIYADQI